MKPNRTRSLLTLLSAAVIFLTPVIRAHDAAQDMVNAAKFFLATLSADQKAKATFPFDSEERENWHFIPRERKGLAFREMSPEQKLVGHALLNTGLSDRGQLKAGVIMSLEEVLYNIEGAADESKRTATREKRDPEKYFVSIFGTPAETGSWGWRVEGHHFSLNFTIKDGQLLRATPSFFGSNPGEVRSGPRTGTRVLGREEDLGRTLVKSLNPEQLKKTMVETTAPKEMITEAKHHVDPLSPEGISDVDLNAEQKELLGQIIHEYLFRVRPEVAEERLKEITAGGAVHFAWAGELERGRPHYYRVQGKTFLLEYDNTQNDANHVHSVWRDFKGDFGVDILAAHVNQDHK